MPVRVLPSSLLALLLLASPALAAKRALLDNFHAEQAGNADWVIDDQQPTPSPVQSAIVPSTARTYWQGAISSWGVDLVKRGFTVTTNNAAFTYGNAANPLDLSNFDVLIVPEPNTLFSAAEATAILNFVRDGGGLVAVGDHDVSDRNNDGFDSPKIWNALDPTFLLGVHWGTAGDANNNIVQTSTNVNAAASDSLTRGPEGNVTALAFHNGTTFTLHPEVNPSVRGEVWMTGLAQTSLTGVMAASSRYGSGRVFFLGDSSPIDDGSANPGNSSIFDGWAEVADSVLIMNATLWASRRAAPAGDAVAPTVAVVSPNGGEDWKAGSTHAITWTASDNVGVTAIDLAWSSDGGATFPNTIATGLANSGTANWTVPDVPGGNMRVRVTARDAAGNSATDASNTSFTISRWTITASAGTGGTVSPNGASGVAQGGTLTITVTPNAHFQISDVLVDGVSTGAVPSVTFGSVTANHTVAASFAADAFTLTTNVVGGGTVTRLPDAPSYAFGTVVQLTVHPSVGWAFGSWSGAAAGTTSPINVAMDAAKTVTATYIDVALPVVGLTSPAGGESWDAGSVHAISWTATDNVSVDSLQLELSVHGPTGPWSLLASGIPNSGTWAWTIPALASDSAYVRVRAADRQGNLGLARNATAFALRLPGLGVGGTGGPLSLARPSPNPASGQASFGFVMPAEGDARLEVLDVTGRVVWSQRNTLGAGAHAWHWDGRDTHGTRVSTGVYLVRLTTPFGTRGTRLAWVR